MAARQREDAQEIGHAQDTASLAHLPVAIFASVMGLCGLTLVWAKAHGVFGVAPQIATGLAGLSVAVFVLLAALYAGKAVLHIDAVIAEYHDPVKLHFLPTMSISLILLSVIALDQARWLAEPVFLAGIGLHFVLTLMVLNTWFNETHFQTAHLNPAWFIPIVGNVLVPLAGVALGYVELSWFFFAIGIVFWLVLFTIITNRVLFHNPLPERLAPTLFILIAPPAVGFLSYLQLTGDLDAFARVLYYFALFLTLFLTTQMPRLMRLRFFLSWWAYSFPLAAITVASLTMADATGGFGLNLIALVMLTVVTLVIAGLFLRTALAVLRQDILRPD